jgi:hypothetical protein
VTRLKFETSLSNPILDANAFKEAFEKAQQENEKLFAAQE